MSIRARSAIGAVLLAGGILGAIGAAVYLRTALCWAALGAAAAGIGIIGWAVRDVAREIGASRAKYEAMLRAELPPEKKEPRPRGCK